MGKFSNLRGCGDFSKESRGLYKRKDGKKEQQEKNNTIRGKTKQAVVGQKKLFHKGEKDGPENTPLVTRPGNLLGGAKHIQSHGNGQSMQREDRSEKIKTRRGRLEQQKRKGG